MKRFALLLCCIAFMGAGPASPNDAPDVFSGTVTSHGAPAAGFRVSLYRGDGGSATFLADRVFVASTTTDDTGNFLLLAPHDALVDSTVTLRAKGFVTSSGSTSPFGGQYVRLSNGPRSNIAIAANAVVDANYGIRKNRYANKTMWFVTDRAPGAAGSGPAFANTAATAFALSYGTFMGSAALGPASEPSGTCAAAGDWSCPGTPVVQDDAYISNVTASGTGVASISTWIDQIAKALPASPKRGRILLFVHGYNTDFATAGATLSRLAFESGQSADVPILYSWPSTHKISGYTQDLKNAEESANTNLVHVLQSLATLHDRAEIDLVAHSMGSFVLTRALSSLDLPMPAFDSVTFFAGDLDDAEFMQALPKLTGNATLVRVYSNSGDQALRVSECFSGDSRLRIGQTPQAFPAPVRWYDATPVAPHGGFGHGYLDESLEVAADFNALITNSTNEAAKATLVGTPWLGGVESTFSVNWNSVIGSAACALIKAAP